LEARGNTFAAETVKQAALSPEVPVFCLIQHHPAPPIIPIFTPPKEEQLKKLGVIKTEQGKWFLPDGREMISKPLRRELLSYLHQGEPLVTLGHVEHSFGSLWVYRDLYTSQTSIRRVSHLSKNEQASPETETTWRQKTWVMILPKHSDRLN
jgi:hypothetical protein